MKKVLSVAMASAMVLGMGVSSFADIQYNVDSNDTAKWPSDFKFDGSLIVVDAEGNKKVDATTAIKNKKDAKFAPGDEIWMPLYANGQAEYKFAHEDGEEEVEAVDTVRANVNEAITGGHGYVYEVNGKYYDGDGQEYTLPENTYFSNIPLGQGPSGEKTYAIVNVAFTYDLAGTAYADRNIVAGSETYYVGTSEATVEEFKAALALGKDAYITVDLAGKEEVEEEFGPIYNTGKVGYGVYTGNIDKDWSINLIEEKGNAKDMVEKAELYRATDAEEADDLGLKANGVYVKVTLKDDLKKFVTKDSIKYWVYVQDNDNKANKTNKVWVGGNFEQKAKKVDFTWTNDASEACLWKAEENGVAVFDFADKAFFTIKMYEGETMYLDLAKVADFEAAKEWGSDDFEAFYTFDNENSNFFREGELILVSDEEDMVVYEETEDGYVEVDAEYVKDQHVAHTNQRVNGFVFNTKQLGNYVIAEPVEEEEVIEEVEEEIEEPAEEVEEAEEIETEKPNPETGAEDFVGLAVSLAVVSVAAAGALALKK